MSSIECPSCRQIDAVQKITSIVGGETHKTTGHGTTSAHTSISGTQNIYAGEGWSKEKVGQNKVVGSEHTSSFSTVNTTQQSTLAQKLMPPIEPKPPTIPKFGSSFSAITGSGCLAVIGGIIAIGIVLSSFFADFDPKEDSIGVSILVVFILTPAVAGIVGALIYHFLDKLAVKAKYPKDIKDKMISDHMTAMADYRNNRWPKWQRAMQRWNSMFYCRRCDVIYVLGDRVKPVSPERVVDLCYHGTSDPI